MLSQRQRDLLFHKVNQFYTRILEHPALTNDRVAFAQRKPDFHKYVPSTSLESRNHKLVSVRRWVWGRVIQVQRGKNSTRLNDVNPARIILISVVFAHAYRDIVFNRVDKESHTGPIKCHHCVTRWRYCTDNWIGYNNIINIQLTHFWINAVFRNK